MGRAPGWERSELGGSISGQRTSGEICDVVTKRRRSEQTTRTGPEADFNRFDFNSNT